MSTEAMMERPAPGKTRSGKSDQPQRRASAETMAARQRDISVSEFFAKNRHLLGFDNPRKALLTAVKEAVDNSLDACEEAGILPEVTVAIEDLQPDRPATAKSSRYRVTVVDNGPGIVRRQVENIFGRLLYGSKFHRLKMSRGQQGIGISAAGMYGLITTGKPMVIHTKPKEREPAHHIELAMNTKTNRAEVTVDTETDDFPPRRFRDLSAAARQLASRGELLGAAYATGTSVSIELEGRYQRGRGSVDEFLELTAIANPHARIVFIPPSRAGEDEESLDFTPKPRPRPAPNPDPPDKTPSPRPPAALDPTTAPRTEVLAGIVVFPRAVADLPPETKEIKPHPQGVELGTLLQMARESQEPTLYKFLQEEFSRVSPAAAAKLCESVAKTSRTRLADVDTKVVESLYRELQEAKLPPPPTDCLAPIGVRQLLAGMLKGVRAEFYSASTRDPAVYRGRPFQIEAAIAFGGELPGDEPARVIRFANRVPLLYQQSACSSFKAVTDTNWRNYDLQQPRAGSPVGPLVIMIHMASVWVPFTSESKEAIADYDEIRKEMKLALQECGRKLGAYLRRRLRMKREAERRDVFERYIGEIAKSCHALTGADAREVYDALLRQAKRRTEIADALLDDEGKIVGKRTDNEDEQGVIILTPPSGDDPPAPGGPHHAAPGSRQAPPPRPARPDAKGARANPVAKTGTPSDAKPTPTPGAKPPAPPATSPTKAKPSTLARTKPPGKSPDKAAGPAPTHSPTPAAPQRAAANSPTPPAATRPAKPRMRLRPEGGLFEINE